MTASEFNHEKMPVLKINSVCYFHKRNVFVFFNYLQEEEVTKDLKGCEVIVVLKVYEGQKATKVRRFQSLHFRNFGKGDTITGEPGDRGVRGPSGIGRQGPQGRPGVPGSSTHTNPRAIPFSFRQNN